MLKGLRRLSVFQKIFCVVSAVMLVSNTFSLVMATRQLGSIVQGQILEGSFSTLRAAQLNISSLVQQATATVVSLTKDAELRQHLSERPDTASQRIQRINGVVALIERYTTIIMNTEPKVTVFGADGEIFSNWEFRGADVLERLRQVPVAYSAQKAQGLVSGDSIAWEVEADTYFDTGTWPAYVLRFALPVMEGNDTIGLVTLMLSQERLSQFIGFANPQTHTTYLVDADGRVLFSTNHDTVGRPLPFAFALPQNDHGVHALDGATLCYQAVGKFNWYLLDVMPNAYARQAVVAAAQTLILDGVLTLAILLVLVTGLARSITRPLGRLTTLMASDGALEMQEARRALGRNEIALLERSYFVMHERLALLTEEKLRTEREKRDTEIKALQSQIRPHFLFNTLNTIRCSAINQNTKKAAEMVLALTQLLRMTLVKADELITLNEEIECLHYYVRIMQERHANVFTIAYHIAEPLKDYRVPTLLLQPIVENSIVHGFARKRQDGVIRVSAFVRDGQVVIRVEDNGRGFDVERIKLLEEAEEQGRFSGIGLGNVERRIKLYYGAERGLTFARADDEWTVVEMTLPPHEENAYD